MEILVVFTLDSTTQREHVFRISVQPSLVTKWSVSREIVKCQNERSKIHRYHSAFINHLMTEKTFDYYSSIRLQSPFFPSFMPNVSKVFFFFVDCRWKPVNGWMVMWANAKRNIYFLVRRKRGKKGFRQENIYLGFRQEQRKHWTPAEFLRPEKQNARVLIEYWPKMQERGRTRIYLNKNRFEIDENMFIFQSICCVRSLSSFQSL